MPDAVTPALTTLEWCALNATQLQFETRLDNHEPPREYTRLRAHSYIDNLGRPAIVLEVDDLLREPERAVYLVEDVLGIEPYYVAAYAPRLPCDAPTPARKEGEPFWVILHAMHRAAHWALGPRRAYHLKWVR